jgi:hypothetical protein
VVRYFNESFYAQMCSEVCSELRSIKVDFCQPNVLQRGAMSIAPMSEQDTKTHLAPEKGRIEKNKISVAKQMSLYNRDLTKGRVQR